MENIIKDLRSGKAVLGNGWEVEFNNLAYCFKFTKDGKFVDSVFSRNEAISFAEKNCKAEKSEAEMLREISNKFFAETKATRKDGSLVMIAIETLSGGDSIRDAGGTRLVTKNVTYDFIKSWADKNGTDIETVCTAIGY